jgi:hypothetical protein
VPAMLSVALLFWLIPPAVLVGGAVGVGLTAFVFPAVLAAVLSALFWMLICYGMAIPPLYGLGYPLGALMTLYIVGRSTWRGSRMVEWRGRVYGSGTAKAERRQS